MKPQLEETAEIKEKDRVRLVNKAQKGNEKAFLELFQPVEGLIYRTAYMYMNNREDALDVVQEAACRSFASIKNLREPEHFKAWVVRIAINCALDEIRKQKKVISLESLSLKETLEAADDPDLSLSLSLLDLLKTLPERNKTIVLLKYYHDFTLQMISEAMDLPLGTVKTILYQSLKKLRVKVGEDLNYE
ncbi:sigma-70 family RNA polymerase sigma factor [Candidatus Contubernalis alkalaceticus]|nr:sigma-70 family RNA polymerase sigma factor [Candidatus Contubernalis alkalaceticus]